MARNALGDTAPASVVGFEWPAHSGAVEVVIRDRGVPPGEFEEISAPFHRIAEYRAARDNGGAGIGLARTPRVLRAG